MGIVLQLKVAQGNIFNAASYCVSEEMLEISRSGNVIMQFVYFVSLERLYCESTKLSIHPETLKLRQHFMDHTVKEIRCTNVFLH